MKEKRLLKEMELGLNLMVAQNKGGQRKMEPRFQSERTRFKIQRTQLIKASTAIDETI